MLVRDAQRMLGHTRELSRPMRQTATTALASLYGRSNSAAAGPAKVLLQHPRTRRPCECGYHAQLLKLSTTDALQAHEKIKRTLQDGRSHETSEWSSSIFVRFVCS
jgi:hypothetical protein